MASRTFEGESEDRSLVKGDRTKYGASEMVGHDPDKWAEFQERYRAEISKNTVPVEELKTILKRGPATLVYAARNEEHNDAVVLREYFQS